MACTTGVPQTYIHDTCVPSMLGTNSSKDKKRCPNCAYKFTREEFVEHRHKGGCPTRILMDDSITFDEKNYWMFITYPSPSFSSKQKFGKRQSRLTGHVKKSKYYNVQCKTCGRFFRNMQIHLSQGYACKVLRGVVE